MSNRVKTILAVTVVVLLLLGAGILWLVSGSDRERQQTQSTRIASAAAPSPSPSSAEPIKVGIILSHEMAKMELLADGQTAQKTPAPWGYTHSTAIMKELRSSAVQLIPVIEPGTETDPPLEAILQRQFAGITPINGHDAAQLGTLDVLVAAQVWNATPEMIAATDQAVSNGLGLLIRQAYGDWKPGFTPQVLRLHGLTDGAYARTTPWNNPVPAEIVGDHPILGTLSGQQGTELPDVLPTGAYGLLTDDAVPLMRLKYLEQIVPAERLQAHPDWSFFTLYTARLGRGTIICCNFDVANQPPKDLQAAAGGAFTLHCVEWLAAQQNSATTQPAMPITEDKPVPLR